MQKITSVATEEARLDLLAAQASGAPYLLVREIR